jgi:hypothetical protein
VGLFAMPKYCIHDECWDRPTHRVYRKAGIAHLCDYHTEALVKAIATTEHFVAFPIDWAVFYVDSGVLQSELLAFQAVTRQNLN